MPQNDFLTFAGAPGANVMSQAAYAALAAQADGFQAGTALSEQLNKVWRQAAIMSAMIGSFIVDNTGDDVIDDGDAGLAAIQASFEAAIQSAVAAAGMPYGEDTGTVNALVANVTPAPASLTDGLIVAIKVLNGNTGATTLNLQGLGAESVVNADGTPLSGGQLTAGGYALFIFDGTNFQMMSLPGPAFFAALVSGVTYTAADTGAADAYVAALTPAPSSLATVLRIPISIKFANANTGASTLNLNSLGATPIKNPDGSDPVAGQITASMHEVAYDGTNFVLLTPPGPRLPQSGKTNYAAAGGTVDAITVTMSPVPTAIPAGFPLSFKASGTNTGVTTISPNGLGPYTIKNAAGDDLAGGEFIADGVYSLMFDGTYFRLTSVPSNTAAAGGGSGAGTGTLLKRTRYTTGSGNFTPEAATTSLVIRGTGGGGGGGSAQQATDDYSSGAGGASGSWGEAAYLVSALTFPAAYAVGAAGAVNANTSGSSGGNTTFGGKVTLPGGGGGAGGINAAIRAGGSPGAAPTFTDAAWSRGSKGEPGRDGIATLSAGLGTGTGAYVRAGAGGSGPWGGGGVPPTTTGAGGAGSGAGAGGAGAAASGAGSTLGGTGSAGYLEIEEWV